MVYFYPGYYDSVTWWRRQWVRKYDIAPMADWSQHAGDVTYFSQNNITLDDTHNQPAPWRQGQELLMWVATKCVVCTLTNKKGLREDFHHQILLIAVEWNNALAVSGCAGCYMWKRSYKRFPPPSCHHDDSGSNQCCLYGDLCEACSLEKNGILGDFTILLQSNSRMQRNGALKGALTWQTQLCLFTIIMIE